MINFIPMFHVFSAAHSLYNAPVANPKADLFARVVMQLIEPLRLSITVLDMICWIVGGAFIFGAIGRYIQHRYNPGQSPIGQSLFLGTLGVLLVLLPIMVKYALPGR